MPFHNGAGFRLVQALLPLTLAAPQRAWVLLTLTPEGVFIFLDAKLIQRYVVFFMILNVLPNGRLIEAYCTHVVSFGPEMPVPILVLPVCMFVEDHQCTLSFEVPHDFRNTVLWWYT